MSTQTPKQPASLDPEFLLGADAVIRARLEQALASSRITPHGLAKLRIHYGLTPAETGVFIEYYLGGNDLEAREPSLRRALARDLHLSENTLMHHITSIRRKLGFAGRKGSATVLVWCLSAGFTELRAIAPYAAESDWSPALRA